MTSLPISVTKYFQRFLLIPTSRIRRWVDMKYNLRPLPSSLLESMMPLMRKNMVPLKIEFLGIIQHNIQKFQEEIDMITLLKGLKCNSSKKTASAEKFQRNSSLMIKCLTRMMIHVSTTLFFLVTINRTLLTKWVYPLKIYLNMKKDMIWKRKKPKPKEIWKHWIHSNSKLQWHKLHYIRYQPMMTSSCLTMKATTLTRRKRSNLTILLVKQRKGTKNRILKSCNRSM